MSTQVPAEREEPVGDTPAVRFVDERLGAAKVTRGALRYVFPDHWFFLLGELALYAFVMLIVTGVFLALFFSPSTATTTYHGGYQPLDGVEVSHAYASTMRLSFDVPMGLLIRQTHHWAALLFLAGIIVHVIRVMFTAAFRKPRELTHLLGVLLLGLGLVEGFAGYSLPDDLLSGMGLAIAYGVVLSIPLVGGQLGTLLWGGSFPTAGAFESRLFIAHVFLLPAAMAALIGAHLALVARHHHTQFRGPGRTERNVVGTPMWPGYALRSLAWMCATFAVLLLLGGLVQINPIWQWGPYEPWLGSNGAQPDWYLGWLIGALRLMPPIEPRFWGHTWAGNPFFGGVLLPTAVFGLLAAWPWVDRRLWTRDRLDHHLLSLLRDEPGRVGATAAFAAFVATIFLAGSADRLFVAAGVPYEAQVWVLRAAVFVVPAVVGGLAARAARRQGDVRR
ncbi:cytochrome b N-terminal domain-containing protein [Paraconexibacter antarcticus]|uniref:Cytochrome bc1 complex cytochrome b subunit n=1 Tax=Paraconexibacter antarcticus TaxID=2949664 RepID=A0ABY5DXH1_9ACTN|nr:cytochrome b N-terminal domain-containing protein [Paraconexibacter antarcticus]UTI65340.1 cytochrome b N-terminal domain-containing protein [Paraconexibacter antarcticus]